MQAAPSAPAAACAQHSTPTARGAARTAARRKTEGCEHRLGTAPCGWSGCTCSLFPAYPPSLPVGRTAAAPPAHASAPAAHPRSLHACHAYPAMLCLRSMWHSWTLQETLKGAHALALWAGKSRGAAALNAGTRPRTRAGHREGMGRGCWKRLGEEKGTERRKGWGEFHHRGPTNGACVIGGITIDSPRGKDETRVGSQQCGECAFLVHARVKEEREGGRTSAHHGD